MTSEERWLDAMWPLVRARLPAPPASVIDIGCGALGGFVPFLLTGGYEAVGVDPEAPDGAHFHRLEFEQLELPEGVDAAIASTSLHHVTDPAEVIDRVSAMLTGGGIFVVVEWAWDDFDEKTAQWCFQRLPPAEGWLHRRRDEWAASGLEWHAYLTDWARREGVHRRATVLPLLDDRFERCLTASGPYFFPDLADTTVTDEQAAIDAGRIRATRIDWVGTRR